MDKYLTVSSSFSFLLLVLVYKKCRKCPMQFKKKQNKNRDRRLKRLKYKQMHQNKSVQTYNRWLDKRDF